ncbi:conserved protein of unknown function [Modestobacter italicus]|uniref:Glycosyltransferase sugar-binding region containing DXD motif n=2 Tax=Modestobacter italicus (strain DSM 44449 / CECT 9708 / BC 501) TaxID=2732864 RepID=I4EYQ2_MODI5|nr:conserved protein of unknown function [Modestobacter marinus]
MRADYFRLCFILENGGLYADADDVYQGTSLDPYISDGRLKLQSLCYDLRTDSMVSDPHAAASQQGEHRIFYVNNNPLIAPRRHPIIGRALERATTLVLRHRPEDRDVQALTGPGNLTACVVAHCVEPGAEAATRDFMLLPDWESVAVSKWSLDYRADQRNWRIWGSQHA